MEIAFAQHEEIITDLQKKLKATDEALIELKERENSEKIEFAGSRQVSNNIASQVPVSISTKVG